MLVEKALFDLIQNWYMATGYVGIVLAMALESCCIPLPSEIVMPLAGYVVFTQPERFSLLGVGIAGTLGCVIGSSIAYAIGASGGRPLLLKYGKYVLISKADSDRADRWFARYGAPVAFFSRLLPVIRTYISLPAGIAEMNFAQFITFTFLGSLPWTFALAIVGYAFGDAFMQKLTRLSTIFHGLDVAILLALIVLVGLYIRRHLKHNAEASASSSSTNWEPPRQPAQRRR
jgi:membrane protein DedA with SNARE-associated domain